MNINEFITETAKIEKYYEKELDDFQRNIWFKELKNVDVSRYRQIIKQVFRKCRFMPKLADIILIQEELPYGTIKKYDVKRQYCEKCNSLGLIFYKKVIENGDKKLEYDFAARCECINGLEYCYDGTKINDTEHRSKFYVATVQQLGF